MWVVNIIDENLREELKITSKLFEKKGEKNKIEVFDSEIFGKVAILNDSRTMLHSEIALDAEMLVHVPMCTNTEIKSILVVDSLNLKIASELKKYRDIEIDFLVEDRDILEAINYLDREHFSDALKSVNIIETLGEKKYDLIIIDRILLEEDNFYPMLTDKGIVVFKSKPLALQSCTRAEELGKVSKDFYIFMPFTASYSLGMDKNYIFASKRLHPQSDINLQKSDLIEDTTYYTSEMHLSSFYQPKFIKESFRGVFKN